MALLSLQQKVINVIDTRFKSLDLSDEILDEYASNAYERE
jgi:hypothetical protein